MCLQDLGWACGGRGAHTDAYSLDRLYQQPAIDEGARSAPYALDSRQRDKVLAVRRQLGDYARLARLVGAYSPNTNALFRSLARSLDEAAAVLLVMLGEALANLGASGQFFLQVPLSELQIRREAALSALRNLTNATQASSLYQNDWQWALNAYRKLFTALEQHGYGDLRALMLEDGLANAMDLMIHRDAKGSIEGLRALGATAQIDLERFHRLALVARQLKLRAPPLAAFIDAIMLFAEAFDVGNGQRLMCVARPPILFDGLYGLRGSSRAEVRLSQIVNLRGQLAEEADCLDQCECDTATRKLAGDARQSLVRPRPGHRPLRPRKGRLGRAGDPRRRLRLDG